MIELLERQEIFKLNKTFASFVIDVQDAKYNPLLDYNSYKAGDVYFDDNDKSRLLTQEECDKLNNEKNEEYLKRKDYFETLNLKKRHSGEMIYKLPFSDLDTYLESLSDGILKLSEKLNWQSVVFLLDYSTPWLYQDNDYKPARKALDYLKEIGTGEAFSGGFKANGQELKELTKNLFWIIRCNAALPDCFFSGVGTDFAADICKYGNIHFHLYSSEEKLGIEKAAKEIGMIEITDGQCFENFTETSAIQGRQIII
jgi:hypothetical protein